MPRLFPETLTKLQEAVIGFNVSIMSQFRPTEEIHGDSAFPTGDFNEMMNELDIEFIRVPRRRHQKSVELKHGIIRSTSYRSPKLRKPKQRTIMTLTLCYYHMKPYIFPMICTVAMGYHHWK